MGCLNFTFVQKGINVSNAEPDNGSKDVNDKEVKERKERETDTPEGGFTEVVSIDGFGVVVVEGAVEEPCGAGTQRTPWIDAFVGVGATLVERTIVLIASVGIFFFKEVARGADFFAESEDVH